MKKKILLGLVAALIVVSGVAGMSAFEAHVINVTAKIENALYVDTTPIDYGTVFPQEALDYNVNIELSQSFLDESDADDVDYVIKQKPKCWSEDDKAYGRVTEDPAVADTFICEQSATANDYVMLPILCPFLSKHEITDDGSETENDTGINAFHGPISDWTPTDTETSKAIGRLAQLAGDSSDTWKIDFRVPCFEDHCSQDWADFVLANNGQAIPEDYILPMNLEHELFGCDLWIEVTGISRVGETCEYSVVPTGQTYLNPVWGTVTYVTITNEDCGTIDAIKVEHAMSYQQGQQPGAPAGWAGISCIEPGYSHVVGGGVWDGDVYAQGPAKAGAPAIDGYNYPVYPHWTFPAGEEGWVVEAAGPVPPTGIYALCAQ